MPEFDVFAPDSYDIGIMELDESSTSDQKLVELPLDKEKEDNRVNPRFGPKHEEAKSAEKENLAEINEILTKPDSNMHTE